MRVLVRHDAGRETLIEELAVSGGANKFLWFRAFPSAPRRDEVDKEIFDALANATHVDPPHSRSIRQRLFGPSIVTLLTRRLGDRPASPLPPEERSSTNRDLEVTQPLVLTEPIATSTLTHRPVMPKALQNLLARESLKIPPSTEDELVASLARRWVVLVSVVRDPRPSTSTPARLGPFRYDFTTPRPLYPVNASGSTSRARYRVYTLGSGALLPKAFETVWDREPWLNAPREPQEYYVTYNQPVVDTSSTDLLLTGRLGMTLPRNPRLVRADLQLPLDRRASIEFLVPDDSVTLPSSNGRRSLADLLACILLGLTPLLYTPESWFLLWLGARAKERARQEGRTLGVRPWAIYAVAVGAFWFATLQQTARIAALVPFVLGMILVALPYTEREPTPVRVEFKKKKKKRKKSQANAA